MQNTRIALFLIFYSVLFNFFAYSLTSGGVAYEDIYYGTISREDLFQYGILLGRNDYDNVTYEGGMEYFDLNDTQFRCNWRPHWRLIGPMQDAMKFWRYTDFLGLSVPYPEKILEADEYGEIENATIVENWDSNWNFSRFTTSSGYEVFIQDPLGEANITRAVYEDGMVLVTIGENLEVKNELSLQNFVNWYIATVTGDPRYGLPIQLSIFTWLFSIMGIFGAVLMIKEVIPFL